MKKKLLLALLVVVMGSGAATELLACGNKFLVSSRGTRFGKVPAAREQAAILVYVNPTSPNKDEVWDLWAESILNQAGYQPIVVASAAELQQALDQGEWDLVLAELPDTEALRLQFASIDAPTMVPVLHDPEKTVVAQAKKDYGHVVKAPFKSQKFIRTIDEAVLARSK